MSYEDLLVKLKKLAEKDTFADRHDEDETVASTGYHADDAYELGCSDGEIFLARELLDKLGVK